MGQETEARLPRLPATGGGLELMALQKWLSVDGYENLPVGEWFVYIPERTDKFHVAVIHKNLQVIGGHLGFDMQPVTHYRALPVGPHQDDPDASP